MVGRFCLNFFRDLHPIGGNSYRGLLVVSDFCFVKWKLYGDFVDGNLLLFASEILEHFPFVLKLYIHKNKTGFVCSIYSCSIYFIAMNTIRTQWASIDELLYARSRTFLCTLDKNRATCTFKKVLCYYLDQVKFWSIIWGIRDISSKPWWPSSYLESQPQG